MMSLGQRRCLGWNRRYGSPEYSRAHSVLGPVLVRLGGAAEPDR
jgi:hypothetical protein